VLRRGYKSWCENAAKRYRIELGVNAEDPLSPHELVSYLGFKVWKPEEIPDVSDKVIQTLLHDDPNSWSAVTLCLNPFGIIIVNSSHSDARQSSDVMHELAHIILAHKAARVDVSEAGHMLLSSYSSIQEEEADWLCGTLLLPRPALTHICYLKMSDQEACRKYAVSRQMLTYRMNVTGVKKQMHHH